jgi:heme/copper-type cytochrome/quinol oxidase subunit 2
MKFVLSVCMFLIVSALTMNESFFKLFLWFVLVVFLITAIVSIYIAYAVVQCDKKAKLTKKINALSAEKVI